MTVWRTGWGTWRESSGDGRYVRDADGVWRYGAGRAECAGLSVVGAVDLTLAELVSPVIGETQRRKTRGPWDDGLPYGTRPDGLYLSLGEVRRRPELRELQGGRQVTDWRSNASWVPIDAQRWQQVEGRVVGLRAPELASSGYAPALAGAQRDVLVARRQRHAAAESRQRVVLSLVANGATRGQLARVLGVSRERVQQLLRSDAQSEDGARLSGAVSWGSLRAADAAWRRSCVRLVDALRVRRQRVLKANRHFEMGLGQIADILGISRSQAQQLRDSAAR